MKILGTLLILLLCGFVFADVIMPGTHPVSTRVRFVNMGDYPPLTFYIITTYPGADLSNASRRVSETPVLSDGWTVLGGYKFNQDYLAVKKADGTVLGAKLDRVSALPASDPRQQVDFSYNINYDASAGTLLLEAAGSNEKPKDDPAILLGVLGIIVLCAAGIWHLKRGNKK